MADNNLSESQLLLLANYEYFHCSTNNGTIKENIDALKSEDGSFDMDKVVLQYHGTYTNENIVGEKIGAIGYSTITKDIGNLVFLYFVRRPGGSISSMRILNTDDLYDIFGEEVLNKIYDYIVKH